MQKWWIITGVSSVAFALLALTYMVAPQALDRADVWVGKMIAPVQAARSIEAFLIVTAFGGGTGIIVVAVGFAYLARLGTASVFRLTFLLSTVLVANKVLKEFFARARPDALSWFDLLPSFSFPSAHATSVMALYGFIAVLLYRRYHRFAYVFLPGLVIMLVGASRVVIGAHYFTDVLGGYLLGLALLALALALPFSRTADTYA